VQESGDTAETLDRRIRGMRAVAEAMKGLLEGAEDKKQSQELEAKKMSIDTLIRRPRKQWRRRRKKQLRRSQQEPRSQRERRR